MGSSVTDYFNYINTSAPAKKKEDMTTSEKKNSLISSDGFLKLLAVQLTNQDCLNPTEDTAFVAQMAQFTALQAMQEVSKATNLQYGASFVGKTVFLAGRDSKGLAYDKTGVVQGVNFSSNETLLIIDGSAYPLKDVKEIIADVSLVGNPNQSAKPEEAPKTDEASETEEASDANQASNA